MRNLIRYEGQGVLAKVGSQVKNHKPRVRSSQKDGSGRGDQGGEVGRH